MGYHVLDGLPWLDAALNAAMILTGMGPVNPISTPAAKIFAIGYALFSGVFFLTMVAVLLTPALHHFLHRFHLDLREQESRKAADDRTILQDLRNRCGATHLRKMRRYDPPATSADTSARMRGKRSPPGYAR